MRSLLAVRGIEKTSLGFRRKLVEIADRNGLNADYLAAVMSFETGGTFSPNVLNPASKFVGLIQFGPQAAAALGTTMNALATMTAEGQLDYVEKYYQRFGPLDSVQDHYTVVFAGGKFSSPDSVLFQAGVTCPKGRTKEPLDLCYQQNKGLDRDGDGVITASDATHPIEVILANAKAKPPILVDMSASESGPVLAGSVFLLAMGIITWSHFGRGLRHSR